MVCELEHVLQKCDVFSAAYQCHMMVQYSCDSGSAKKLYCRCFLLCEEINGVILNVRSC